MNNPFSPLLSELLNYDTGFVPKKEELGIKDLTYDLMGKYGEPSENWADMINWPNWSPLEAWGMWLHRPEPVMTVIDSRLSSLISQPESKVESKPESDSMSIMDIMKQLKARNII